MWRGHRECELRGNWVAPVKAQKGELGVGPQRWLSLCLRHKADLQESLRHPQMHRCHTAGLFHTAIFPWVLPDSAISLKTCFLPPPLFLDLKNICLPPQEESLPLRWHSARPKLQNLTQNRSNILNVFLFAPLTSMSAMQSQLWDWLFFPLKWEKDVLSGWEGTPVLTTWSWLD